MAADAVRLPLLLITYQCGLLRAAGSELGRTHHAPDGVPHIVGNKESASLVERNSDRATHRLSVLFDKSGKDIDWLSGRHPIREGHEDHLVSAPRLTIPGAVLPDEHPTVESCGQRIRARPREAE